jgi:predicted TIM-barrel fold metal-dependent hydrolase
VATGLLRGLCFFPAMHRYGIQDDRATALLDLAAAHAGTVAFVHCGVLSVGVRRKLGLPSLFDMRFSNPIDLHAVALRYPQLHFVVPHFGAGYFREALMLCDLCPNVFLDTSSSNSWMRYEEPHDLRTVFRRALDVCGPKRLLFGTDSSFFPRGWHAAILDAQMKALYEIGINAEVARAILHENLQHLVA